LLDHLFEHFQVAYTPESNISVDESLLLWKGRLIFKQYIPLKRARFGIKLYFLCESSSGYCYRFKVYSGKDDPVADVTPQLPQVTQGFTKPEKMVIYLMLPLLDKGYSIFMDNYYSTPRLYLYLLHRMTHACGTLRKNNVPVIFRNINIPVGQMQFYRANKLLCIKFHDRKLFHMLTTMHGVDTVRVRQRGQRAGEEGHLIKPVAVRDYNAQMGGVDLHDQISFSKV